MRVKGFYILLVVLMVLLFLLNLISGSVIISPISILKHYFSTSVVLSDAQVFIFEQIRMPRALTALFVGASLSVAGLLMQTFFQNPLAGPFTLGISSGASLGVAIYIILGSLFLGAFSNLGLLFFAIVGAFLTLGIVILASFRIKDNVALLIIGLMFGSLTTAIVCILEYFAPARVVYSFVIWSFGSLTSVDWHQISILAPISVLSIVASLFLYKPLNVLLLGENYTKTIGYSISKIRIMLLLITGIMTGVATAFVGPIAFIGVAVPHIARNLIKTSNHKYLILLTSLVGACLMLFCDIIAQMPGTDKVLPISAVTSLFGAPIVIWVIVKSNKL